MVIENKENEEKIKLPKSWEVMEIGCGSCVAMAPFQFELTVGICAPLGCRKSYQNGTLEKCKNGSWKVMKFGYQIYVGTQDLIKTHLPLILFIRCSLFPLLHKQCFHILACIVPSDMNTP